MLFDKLFDKLLSVKDIIEIPIDSFFIKIVAKVLLIILSFVFGNKKNKKIKILIKSI